MKHYDNRVITALALVYFAVMITAFAVGTYWIFVR